MAKLLETKLTANYEINQPDKGGDYQVWKKFIVSSLLMRVIPKDVKECTSWSNF